MWFVVATAGVCAPGCARRESTASGPATVRIGVGAPQNQSRGSGAKFVVDALTTETWLSMQLDGRQGERLFSHWQWDNSGTAVALTLRRNVFFHDGTELTPAVAAEAIRKNRGEEPYPSFSSIRAITPTADGVRITLSEPSAFLLADLALTSARLPTNNLIATGPFQIESNEAEQKILKAFPRYYRGTPGIGRIEVNIYPTQRKAWTALMRGDLDMLHEVSRDAAEFVEAETTVKTYSFPRTFYIPLVFSTRHPILKRVEVRTAINEALDRAALVRDGLRSRGRPADGPLWPQHWAFAPEAPRFAFDPNAAKARLDKAGLVARPGEGGVPTRFSFSCLTFANDTRFERLEVLVQKQLADVGIDMKLVPLPQNDLVVRLQKGDFDAFIFEMAGRSLSWVYTFWRSQNPPTMVDTGYRSADTVLDRIKTARSDDEVKAYVAELGRILHDDPPAAFLAWQETSRAVSHRFDVAAEENRDIFTNIWQWRPRKDGMPQTSR